MPDYKNMMGPTLSKGLTGLSTKKLGGGSGMSSAKETMDIIARLSRIEAPYKEELEDLAATLCKEMFPVIDEAGYQINAKIAPISDINASLREADQTSVPFSDEERRRIINANTQGASVRATEDFQFNDLYNDYIGAINPELRTEYANLTKHIFKVYHDKMTIPMMLRTAQAGEVAGAGSSKVRVVGGDIKEDKAGKRAYIIDAMGVCFPVLIHEIVKGLYEILSRHGLTGTKDANQAVVDAVDTLENEIDDIQYGRFIHEAILMPYERSQYKHDARIRELLIVSIYKLKDDFAEYVRTALASYITSEYNGASDKEKKYLQHAYNELMEPAVKAKWQADWKKWTGWANGVMAQGDRYFKKKDTGLEDLDY